MASLSSGPTDTSRAAASLLMHPNLQQRSSHAYFTQPCIMWDASVPPGPRLQLLLLRVGRFRGSAAAASCPAALRQNLSRCRSHKRGEGDRK